MATFHAHTTPTGRAGGVGPRLPARCRAYFELLRPANITTAFADVLAGYAVAGRGNRGALPWLLLATGCLYGGGVVLNDFFDRTLDSVERPERPIPSGRVRPAGAAWLGAALLLAGAIAASRATYEAGLIALAIVTLVIAYDSWSKHHWSLGPLTMGACRGLNLVLGIAAVPGAVAAHWPVSLLSFTYICAVTALSRGEVHGGPRPVAGYALLAIGAVILALLALALQSASLAIGVALTLLLAWRVLPTFWQAYRQSTAERIRQAVRTGVLSLVVLDAALSGIYAGTLYGVLVLLAAVFAGRLARWFAVT
jgi:4-hydroxybenzoate polyprenyltransferase